MNRPTTRRLTPAEGKSVIAQCRALVRGERDPSDPLVAEDEHGNRWVLGEPTNRGEVSAARLPYRD